MRSKTLCKKTGSLKLFGSIFFSLICGASGFAQEQVKPNIIILLTDDLGFGDIGCYYNVYATPHIDRLATEGVMFTNYYTAAPICSPSRAGLLTGISPAKLNFTTFLHTRKANKAAEQADYLDTTVWSMAKLLRDHGYATAHYGKWHLGGGRDVTDAPNFDQYGFDDWAGTYESPAPDPLLTAADWIWSDQDSIKRWNRTSYLIDKTLEFLAKNKDQPSFVNLWIDDVHTPWVPGDDSIGRYPTKPNEEKSFIAVLTELDKQVGRLMEGLQALGIDQNTLVIFTSDNGPMPNFRQDRSAGLRGSKLSLYEGGIRVPFIARWPQKIAKGRVDSTSVLAAIDLLPSLSALAGIKVPQEIKQRFDGEDRSTALLEKASSRATTLFWEYGRSDTAFNFPQGRNRSPSLALREGHWKFLMNVDRSRPELYDLRTDSAENRNLVTQYPELVKRFGDLLINWRRSSYEDK